MSLWSRIIQKYKDWEDRSPALMVIPSAEGPRSPNPNTVTKEEVAEWQQKLIKTLEERKRSMTEQQYTPSTQSVRHTYAYLRDDGEGEFDRWLAKVCAEARAEALREAADEYRSGQLTGVYLSRDGYTQAWLRARADREEQDNA